MKQQDMPMITVRVPLALRLAVKELARERRTSVNTLLVNIICFAVSGNANATRVLEAEREKKRA